MILVAGLRISDRAIAERVFGQKPGNHPIPGAQIAPTRRPRPKNHLREGTRREPGCNCAPCCKRSTHSLVREVYLASTGGFLDALRLPAKLEVEAMPENVSTPEAPTWDPYREGQRVLQELREAEGGAYTPSEACACLGISREELKALHDAKELVVWADAHGHYRIPRWQFRDGKILPGIGACLRLAGEDSAGHLKFFLTPAESSGGRSPLALLREGRVDEALEIAREAFGD